MEYKEIIDTIKVGDVIEHAFDGHLIVDKIDIDDRDMTLRCSCWKENSNIIRKVSVVESSCSVSKEDTQDSQNENDDSQCGNEIVVGSKWVCVKADPDIDCDISIGGVYSVVDVYGANAKYVTFVDDVDEEQEWPSAGFKKQFKLVEQSTEQLVSEKPSEGVVKAGEVCDPEPPSCVKLQYDPRDVAFTKDTFPEDTLTKHYNFFYTLTEDDVEAGCLKLDPYFVSQQWKLGKKDDTGVLFHCLKTLARYGDKNDVEREIKALNAQVRRLAELHNIKL